MASGILLGCKGGRSFVRWLCTTSRSRVFSNNREQIKPVYSLINRQLSFYSSFSFCPTHGSRFLHTTATCLIDYHMLPWDEKIEKKLGTDREILLVNADRKREGLMTLAEAYAYLPEGGHMVLVRPALKPPVVRIFSEKGLKEWKNYREGYHETSKKSKYALKRAVLRQSQQRKVLEKKRIEENRKLQPRKGRR